jgi:hypothetical protein
MWGINLFSLSQVETQSLEEDPKKTELIETGAVQSFYFKPKPFLYYYFRELGYRVKMVAKVPYDNDQPLLLIDPPDKIEMELLRDVFQWIRKGGSLVVFMPRPHPVDRFTGIERRKFAEKSSESKYLDLAYLYDVERISPVEAGMARRPEASLFSVFAEQGGITNLFMTFKGKGRIVLLSHPDLISGRGLKLADNVVLVTRLIEHLSWQRSINILDTEPSLKIKTRARKLVKRTGTSLVKKKVDHYSFWSLLKANPISWVLAQMIVALAVYFYSTSRRFGRARRFIDNDPAPLSHIKNLGSLLAEQQDASFAMKTMMKDFIASAVRRFGLDSEANFTEIVEEIRRTDPEVAQSLKNVERDLFHILSGRTASATSLLRVVRTLENARKELKLYD